MLGFWHYLYWPQPFGWFTETELRVKVKCLRRIKDDYLTKHCQTLCDFQVGQFSVFDCKSKIIISAMLLKCGS